MKKLNYQKLMAYKPTVYQSFTNCLGQSMEFVEHPLQGDLNPVIVVFKDEELAFETDFYDTHDFYIDSDYQPVLVNGECMCYFEIE
jgi:hypothetical protein